MSQFKKEKWAAHARQTVRQKSCCAEQSERFGADWLIRTVFVTTTRDE